MSALREAVDWAPGRPSEEVVLGRVPARGVRGATAAARGAIAIREVERATIVDHDLTECTKRVRNSPGACRRLLQALTDGDELVSGSDPRWDPVRGLLIALAERRQAYLRLPHWRR